MTAPIAITASYSDFKLVKSRSVAQILLELPIERAEEFVTAFGLPMPGSERPVALALLNHSGPPPEERPSQTTAPPPDPQAMGNAVDKPMAASLTPGQKAVQRCAILCADQRFQDWANGRPLPDDMHPNEAEKLTADWLRLKLRIVSRSEIGTDPAVRERWRKLETQYLQDTGQLARDFTA